jgi:hypothetical protein
VRSTPPDLMDPECATWLAQLSTDGGSHTYTTAAGSKVVIPLKLPLGPWVAQTQPTAVHGHTQGPFKASIGAPNRQSRAALSLRYDVSFRRSIQAVPARYLVDADGTFTYNTDDPFTLAAIGDTKRLIALVESSPGVLERQDESGDSLLYKAARSGFCDMVEALLAKGANPNTVKVMGSSPLHAASFFGHVIVAASLLARSCDRTLTNKYGNTALDEASTHPMRQLLAAEAETTLKALADAGVGTCLRPLHYDGDVVAWRIDRNPQLIMDSLCAGTPRIPANWRTVWHGTKAENLESILRHDLQAAGCGRLGAQAQAQGNHPALGQTVFGIENFAGAVFVSPAVAYAAHPCYAGRLIGGGEEFIVLVEARVRPGSYKTFASGTGDTYISQEALAAAKQGEEDREIPAGTRIRVDGYGDGSVEGFVRNKITANEFLIRFDNSSDRVTKLKLRECRWSVVEFQLQDKLHGHPTDFGHPEVHGEDSEGDDSVNTILRVSVDEGTTNVVVTGAVLLKRQFLSLSGLSNRAMSSILVEADVFESTISCRQEMMRANAVELGVPDLAEHIAEVEDMLALIPGDLDAEEQDRRYALSLYTKESLIYSQFNAALRRKGAALVPWRPYQWHLERCLRALPDVQRTVHRGVKNFPHLAEYGQSKKIRWQGFTCTSTSTDVAKSFANQPGDAAGLIFKIDIYNGKDVAHYSCFPAEKELLLSPNMEFVVTKALHVPDSGELEGCNVIEMQQLSSTTLWS